MRGKEICLNNNLSQYSLTECICTNKEFVMPLNQVEGQIKISIFIH